MAPDEPFSDQHPQDPQSWNLYVYARNNPLTLIDPDGAAVVVANSIKIGTAAVSGYRPQTTFDISSMVSTFFPTTALKLDNMEGSGTNVMTPTQNSGGGCIFACYSTYTQTSVGITLSVSFTYNEKDQLDGAVIKPSVDQSAVFIGPNPPNTVTVGGFLPGVGAAPPDPTIVSIRIDSGALRGLSPNQLVALSVAATKLPSPSLAKAINQAVIQEQTRRSKLQLGNGCTPETCTVPSITGGFLSH